MYELGFVFVLPFRCLRPWLCVLGIFFHLGIALVMGLNFWPLMIYYPTLIDWGRFLGPPAEPMVVPAANSTLHRLGLGLVAGMTLAGFGPPQQLARSGVMPTFAEMASHDCPRHPHHRL